MTAEDYDDLLMQSLLLEEIGQSVIALDRGWRVTYWNRASERLYGYAAEEVRGRKITELSLIAGPEAAGREIADTLLSGRTWSGEYVMRDRDGRKFPIHATVAPVRGTHPVPVAVVAVSKDISERKRAEALLRRMSALVESSGDAIIGADLDGTVTSWNAGAARMFGWRPAEALGRDYQLLTTRTDAGFRKEVLARLQTSGFATGVEARWKRKDGTVLDVSLTVSPVFDDDGQRVGDQSLPGTSPSSKNSSPKPTGNVSAWSKPRKSPTSEASSLTTAPDGGGTRRNTRGSSAEPRTSNLPRKGFSPSPTRMTVSTSRRSFAGSKRVSSMSNTSSGFPPKGVQSGGCMRGPGWPKPRMAGPRACWSRSWTSLNANAHRKPSNTRPSTTA